MSESAPPSPGGNTQTVSPLQRNTQAAKIRAKDVFSGRSRPGRRRTRRRGAVKRAVWESGRSPNEPQQRRESKGQYQLGANPGKSKKDRRRGHCAKVLSRKLIAEKKVNFTAVRRRANCFQIQMVAASALFLAEKKNGSQSMHGQ